MSSQLPVSALEFTAWPWARIEPYYIELRDRPLTADSISQWLADWSVVKALLIEALARLSVAQSAHTDDMEIQNRMRAFYRDIFQPAESYEIQLEQRLLKCDLTAPGYERQLHNLRAGAQLFRAENQPLKEREMELTSRYDEVIGGQMVEWQGERVPLKRMEAVLGAGDRNLREQAWRARAARQLADRESFNDLWRQLLETRTRIAHNAGYGDYRAYRWQEMARRDYTPADCATFHTAIENIVVPVATRIYEKHRRRLGVEAFRPWDLATDFKTPATPAHLLALRPFTTGAELITKCSAIFYRLDHELGNYFDELARAGMLDVESRPGKWPGGMRRGFAVTRQSFILMNATGTQEDVITLLHEAGHAFSGYESRHQPFLQMSLGSGDGGEWTELCSQAMEFLSTPHLTEFYSEADAARARVEHLEGVVMFWPYMAVMDAFQHWAYTHPAEAVDPAQCDAHWGALWSRFLPGVDWSGLEAERVTGWQRKWHIFAMPFYYIDYGVSLLGALQIGRNASRTPRAAVAAYRQAMGLGGGLSLSERYAAAGAKFAFDAATLREAITHIESTLAELETQ